MPARRPRPRCPHCDHVLESDALGLPGQLCEPCRQLEGELESARQAVADASWLVAHQANQLDLGELRAPADPTLAGEELQARIKGHLAKCLDGWVQAQRANKDAQARFDARAARARQLSFLPEPAARKR